MKYSILVILVVALTITAKAQTLTPSQVPPGVTTTFTTQFPKTNDLTWEMQNGSNYYATFGMNGEHYTALFDPSGMWLETGTQIQKSNLPASVTQSINNKYSGYTISNINSLKQKDSDMLYQVKLMKGTEQKEIFLNAKGETAARKYAKMDKMDRVPNKQ